MKMKPYIGKEVRLHWIGDPIKVRSSRATRKLGRAGLARWLERGLVEQVVDGVVHILHSEAYAPGVAEWDEVEETLVPEDLIESVVVLKEEQGALHQTEPPRTA